jgi:hypothetical protein
MNGSRGFVRKVFHFDAPRENYRCDAAVVWCFDHRFHRGFEKFLKRAGFLILDPIKIAGGAKSLASPEHESDKEFVIGQIQKSRRLHATNLAILMTHSDCGAYGGLAGGFGNDTKLEMERHERELKIAAESIQQNVPGMGVQAYFVDFEGVWKIDLSPVNSEPGRVVDMVTRTDS